MNRILSAKNIGLTIGPLSLQANAMREIKDSIENEFDKSVLEKNDIQQLLDEKINSLYGKINFLTSQNGTRESTRHKLLDSIKIIRTDGEEINGKLIDVSKRGISFKTKNNLKRNETLKIFPINDNYSVDLPVANKVKIVRKKFTEDEFEYGAVSMP